MIQCRCSPQVNNNTKVKDLSETLILGSKGKDYDCGRNYFA